MINSFLHWELAECIGLYAILPFTAVRSSVFFLLSFPCIDNMVKHVVDWRIKRWFTVYAVHDF